MALSTVEEGPDGAGFIIKVIIRPAADSQKDLEQLIFSYQVNMHRKGCDQTELIIINL
jgi:hypothetical protein